MKIPKLFKKAVAFVMAAVTALSIMPATAFAAGDIGTISFSHTYDSKGNAMRYNSSANIGGYTAGGTGNYKYRMFVDGENAFCIQPGVPLKTGNTLKKASSDTWNALSANQKKAVGLALLYGYQGNRNNLSGSDDEKWLATQTLVWEFVTGCREATGSYNQTSTTVYSLHFGSNYANSGARAVYDQIVAMLREHNTIPSFMSGGKNDITKELAYKDGKYSITLTDSNGVLSDYSFSSSDSNVSVSKSGNKLTISSTVAISGSVRITAKRNNVPTVSSSAKLIAYGDPNLQDLVTGVENADTVSAYINIETPTGTIALKKTSEDGVVEGISFTIKGDNFNKTVKTGKDGSVSVEGLFPGTYTVTEQSIDRYEPQKTQTVTLIGGKTSTVTFSNTLKRGSLEIVKTSEDNLVEGMKFHLYGTSLSGLPVDEYRSHLLTGILKCPLCGSSMYTNKHAWTNKDGTYKEVYYYICGRNKQERGHHCDYKASLRKTDIEPLVIEAVKELVSDKYFAKEIEKRIGVQTDTTAIDKELANYESKLKEVDLNKARLEREIDNLPIDARFRERKIHDMTLRLDALYDTIVELEERIEDAKLRKSSIEMETITLDNIYKLMLNFGKLYDIISDEEKKSLITYLIKEIQIYPNGESEQPLKSIEFNFPIYRDGQEVRRLLWEKGNTVEAVVLMTRTEAQKG